MACHSQNRSRSRRSKAQWRGIELADELNMAKTRPYAPSIHSPLNSYRVDALNEVFPTFPSEVIEDVLLSAHMDMETAAAMLSDLTQVTQVTDLEADYVNVQAAEDEPWDDLSDECRGTEEWEVVDHCGNRVRTFADVLRESMTQPLPPLRAVTPHVHRVAARHATPKQHTPTEELPLSIKSFGTRKRRFLKKCRR